MNRMPSRLYYFAALFTSIVVFVHPSAAQQNEAKPVTPVPVLENKSSDQDTLPAPVIDESSESSRIFLDKVEVLGTVAKPQALFIIPGTDPKVDGIEIDRSFFREIFRPLEKDYQPKNTRRLIKGQILW